MNIVIIDNYDSFTYNLVHYFEALDHDVIVFYNDQIDFLQLDKSDAVVLSPGPGLPKSSGQLMEVIAKYYSSKPILGICLGMQALAQHDGLEIYNMNEVCHGISKSIHVDVDSSLFRSLSPQQEVGLYHSWAVKVTSSQWKDIAKTQEGVAMAIAHTSLPHAAVQFHPESVMTPNGMKMLDNWLSSLSQHKSSILVNASEK